MKTFVDAAGRTWAISLNLESAMRVRDTLNIDLLQPEAGDPPLITRIGTDEVLLGQVILALINEQFEAQKLTEQDVRKSFDGRTILDAQKAFYEELVDFFRSRGRSDRAAAIEKQARIIELATQLVSKKIEALDVEETVSGAMSGSLQAPSE